MRWNGLSWILVDFSYHANSTSYMNVTVTVPDTGYRIDWNDVMVNGSEFYVDAEIWDYNGPSHDTITYHYHTYTLGNLSLGTYVFSFRAWGEYWGEAFMKAYNTSFLVSPFDLTKDGYVGVDDIILIAEHFGQSSSHSNWNDIFDMNQDDYIGIDDIITIAQHFGESA